MTVLNIISVLVVAVAVGLLSGLTHAGGNGWRRS